VDISKAFDTVPHSAIEPCLARKSVPAPIIELIKNMYNGINTKIKSRNNMGVEITIFRGVKQGDPLSPLLFNLCLEPLLELIEKKTSGINVNDTRKIPVLPFADDVVLLGANEGEAQCQMDMLKEYLNGLGMTISREKSQTFQIVSKRDSCFTQEPGIKLGENTIRTVDPGEAFRYLGTKMGPWKGVLVA
jgi:retron-type reverse transcriptase